MCDEEVVCLSAGHMSIMAADNTSDREVTEAEAPGAASDLNRSDLDPIYIGGLPMSRPIRYVSSAGVFFALSVLETLSLCNAN